MSYADKRSGFFGFTQSPYEIYFGYVFICLEVMGLVNLKLIRDKAVKFKFEFLFLFGLEHNAIVV